MILTILVVQAVVFVGVLSGCYYDEGQLGTMHIASDGHATQALSTLAPLVLDEM